MSERLTARDRQLRQVMEQDLMVRFMDHARSLGWKVMHVSDSRMLTRRNGKLAYVADPECRGWPDLFMAHPETGRLLAVEVKREVEKPTSAQQEWLDALTECGIETFVLRPSNEDWAKEQLRSLVAA